MVLHFILAQNYILQYLVNATLVSFLFVDQIILLFFKKEMAPNVDVIFCSSFHTMNNLQHIILLIHKIIGQIDENNYFIFIINK
jgi:hypothetical protein